MIFFFLLESFFGRERYVLKGIKRWWKGKKGIKNVKKKTDSI